MKINQVQIETPGVTCVLCYVDYPSDYKILHDPEASTGTLHITRARDACGDKQIFEVVGAPTQEQIERSAALLGWRRVVSAGYFAGMVCPVCIAKVKAFPA
jgi:hypothetical protein